MSVILKSWLAFAALGAGILHLALAPILGWAGLVLVGSVGSSWRLPR